MLGLTASLVLFINCVTMRRPSYNPYVVIATCAALPLVGFLIGDKIVLEERQLKCVMEVLLFLILLLVLLLSITPTIY